MRARYFYALTPIAIVFGTAVLLTIPYLAVIVFGLVALALLAALAWAIVSVPFRLVRALGRRRNDRRVGPARPALALAAVTFPKGRVS